jgi:hypothetical protein
MAEVAEFVHWRAVAFAIGAADDDIAVARPRA